jgi:voltage-gated potassium channel
MTSAVTRRGERVVEYERRSAVPMTVMALIFLAVYATSVLWQDRPPAASAALDTATVAIWAVFAVDLVVRVALAERRLRYLLTHPIDVLSVVLPMLRPLRVLRVFTAGQVLFRRGAGLARSGQAVVVAAGLLVFIGGLAALDAERGAPEASITSFGNALWWAVTTVTTVGYGDLYPVTTLGRLVAVSLMVVGVSLVGLVTATVASWFISQGQQRSEAETEELSARLRRLEDKLDRLLAERERTPGPR